MTASEQARADAMVDAETFQSADGSTRCCRCHLHPDACTCRPDHPMRLILHEASWLRGAP